MSSSIKSNQSDHFIGNRWDDCIRIRLLMKSIESRSEQRRCWAQRREDILYIRSYRIHPHYPPTPVQGDMHVNAINGAPATHRVLFEPKAKPHINESLPPMLSFNCRQLRSRLLFIFLSPLWQSSIANPKLLKPPTILWGWYPPLRISSGKIFHENQLIGWVFFSLRSGCFTSYYRY